ncbi:hypothetical protein [Gemmatimonas phototrophica]|uniref:IPT/TIG domain-containing protein n=1 Tax=Gemmatimonas phototrophica TaxID=1379270 RepID=A0A143BIA4_9BACT|nr:hypothetical protein [Gemmatimonas phototrophica]AMW04144.1 hypothetical protein GEMMAAP_03440 [Gemmatimonas phototrophica]
MLHACSGADALSPEVGNPSAPTPVPSDPVRIVAVGPDTLVAGSLLVVEGENIPADAAVTVTVGGQALPIRAQSATRFEALLPVGAFPCGATAAHTVQVQVGATVFEARRPLRTAQRVALEAGQSISLLDAQPSRCVELAPAAVGENARYVVAVVNTSTTAGNVASFELRGMSAAASGAPASGFIGGATSGLLATPSIPLSTPALTAARRVLEQMPAAEAAHGARLGAQRSRLTQAGSAVSAWQLARSRSSLLLGGGASAAAQRFAMVGDTLTLMASASSCNTGKAVRARVVYAGSKAVVLEDITAMRAGTMDGQYRKIGGEFDSVVYPLLQQNIGDPLAMNAQLSGDGRVTMLFTRFVNDSLPGTAAFVNACNFYPRSTFAASNQDEVFYARVPGAWETPEEWRRAIRASVVHEAKHLASFAERMSRGVQFEEPWLEEATARIAEELYARTFPGGGSWKGNTGFASSVGCELTQCDDRPLIMWKHFSVLHQYLRGADTLSPLAPTGANDNTYYASGWSLVRWMVDTYASNESTWLKALVRGDGGLVGMPGLVQRTGASVPALTVGWAVANLQASQRETPGQVNSQSWNLADHWTGMSTVFPGAFSSEPIRKITPPVLGEGGIVVRQIALGVSFFGVTATASEPLVLGIHGRESYAPSFAIIRSR